MNATATATTTTAPPAPTTSRRALRMSELTLVAFAAVLIALLAYAAPSHAAPNVQFGTEQNGGMDGADQRTDLLNRQKDVGSSVIRLILRWDRVATCNPGVGGTNPANACYNWATPDAVAAGAAARGMQVIYSIYGVPSWRNGGKGETFTGNTDAEFNAFSASYADFVQAAVTRYDGKHGQTRVNQWTIWNEPNGQFWTPLRATDGSLLGARRYARLYDLAARRLKAVDPTMLVAVGPTAPMARKDAPPIEWASVAAADINALGSPVDAWAHNGYMGTQSAFKHTVKSPFVGLGNISDLTNLLDTFNGTRGKPIWITEMGYQTQPSFQSGVPIAQHGLLLADAMRFAFAHPRITNFIWYSVLDDDTATGFKSGLFFQDNACGTKICPKPAASIYRHPLWVSDQKNDLVTLWGRGGRAGAQTRIFVRPVGGTWHAYKNADTATTGAVTLTIKLTGNVEAMTCDTVCGPMRTIVRGATTPDAANSTKKIIKKKLKATKLRKNGALARGIAFRFKCAAGCTVSSQIFAKGKASGIKAAAKKQVLISGYTSKKISGGRMVIVKFKPSARKQILTYKGAAKLTMRITMKSGGQTIVYDRALVLF